MPTTTGEPRWRKTSVDRRNRHDCAMCVYPRLVNPRQHHLDGDPHYADHYVHTLGLSTLVLETPHAVLFVVPVRAGRAVHAPSTDFALFA